MGHLTLSPGSASARMTVIIAEEINRVHSGDKMKHKNERSIILDRVMSVAEQE